MEENKSINQCPEFPYFGARYPDATCIDGRLFDLDQCDENGNLYDIEGPPCPFCKTEDFIKHEAGDLDDYENKEEYQKEVTGIKGWIQSIKEMYDAT